jgi:hypothetical protein
MACPAHEAMKGKYPNGLSVCNPEEIMRIIWRMEAPPLKEKVLRPL